MLKTLKPTYASELKYRIQCKIGEGSFSEVLKCQNRESGQLIAAKRLKKTFQNVAEAAEIPEVIAMKRLPQHPNILNLIESHYEPIIGKVTLIFDLMDMSVYDMMKNRKRPLPESRVKNYLYQILKGVSHLHNHGIFHRDIKPENILVKGDQIKVADLGSVRGIYSKRPYTEYISTRWYRSPECLLTAGYYGPKMDVWAIGCVFYELLTLKPLFPGSNEIDQIAKIHTILGTPSSTIITRFKKHKSQHTDINFPPKIGTGFGALLQNISDSGREILKSMLVYDPKIRSATRRLLENRYFNDLRESDILKRRTSVSSTSTASSATEWRNPVLLSFITSERKRKQKQVNVLQSKVPRPIQPLSSNTSNKSKTPPKLPIKVSRPVGSVHSKASLNKSLSKTQSKTKLIQREVHRMQPLFQRHPQVLQETTNILHVPTGNTVTSSTSVQSANIPLQSKYATASTSFLPMLSGNISNPIHSSSRTQLLRNNSSQRQCMHKQFLSSTKPRLEPIMEHITPRQCVNRKLIRSIPDLNG